MNKHRIKIANNPNSKLFHKNNVDSCLDHLSIAHHYLFQHLNGKNHMGLLTNILNASFDIKKHLK